MSDIFLSYTADDRDRVRPIVERLKERGWSIWWDRQILPGEYWPEVIQNALSDCRAVVVIWTARSVASTWVRLEANAGTEIGGLVPIRLDKVVAPLEFRHLHAADLVGWDGKGEHPELASAFVALDKILAPKGGAPSDQPSPTLGSATTLGLSLSLGGDLGSSDPRDLGYIHGLVREAGRKAVPALLAALEFPEPERRGHAAYLLGVTGDPDVVGALVPLLSDRTPVGTDPRLPTVRSAAALALRNIGTPEAIRALAAAFV